MQGKERCGFNNHGFWSSWLKVFHYHVSAKSRPRTRKKKKVLKQRKALNGAQRYDSLLLSKSRASQVSIGRLNKTVQFILGNCGGPFATTGWVGSYHAMVQRFWEESQDQFGCNTPQTSLCINKCPFAKTLVTCLWQRKLLQKSYGRQI